MPVVTITQHDCTVVHWGCYKCEEIIFDNMKRESERKRKEEERLFTRAMSDLVLCCLRMYDWAEWDVIGKLYEHNIVYVEVNPSIRNSGVG